MDIVGSTDWLLTLNDCFPPFDMLFEVGRDDVIYAIWQVESSFEKYDDYVEVFVQFITPKTLSQVQQIYSHNVFWVVSPNTFSLLDIEDRIAGPWEIGIRTIRRLTRFKSRSAIFPSASAVISDLD